MTLPLNTIICGDCLEVLRTLPDKCVDLVLTDQPYGIDEHGGAKNRFSHKSKEKGFSLRNYDDGNWDNEIPSKEYFDEITRVSKNQIIFGGNYFVEYLRNSPCWLVWDKKETANNDFADCELIYTSFKTAVRKFVYGWTGFEGINNLSRTNERRTHPTQKPTPLLRWILENYSKEGDIILDPFLGSGTTALACKALKRNYIGIEISPEYCAIAQQRLDNTPEPML